MMSRKRRRRALHKRALVWRMPQRTVLTGSEAIHHLSEDVFCAESSSSCVLVLTTIIGGSLSCNVIASTLYKWIIRRERLYELAVPVYNCDERVEFDITSAPFQVVTIEPGLECSSWLAKRLCVVRQKADRIGLRYLLAFLMLNDLEQVPKRVRYLSTVLLFASTDKIPYELTDGFSPLPKLAENDEDMVFFSGFGSVGVIHLPDLPRSDVGSTLWGFYDFPKTVGGYKFEW